MIDFQTPRAIILHFPRYAGGKFISNCLSLSKYACPQHASAVDYLIENPTDYQYRLNKVMTTLPPQNDAHNWINRYEFGDQQLFGPSVLKWRNGVAVDQTTVQANRLLQTSMHFFFTSHGHPSDLLKVWSCAKVIILINHWEFSRISKQLKFKLIDTKNHAGNYCKEHYELLSGDSWPNWDEFESSGFNAKQFVLTHPAHIVEEMIEFYPKYNTDTIITFDIDNCIFNQHKFLASMERLYQKLNFDDFNADLITKFWQAYIDLHIDTSQNV
jgi:hypothetical protein